MTYLSMFCAGCGQQRPFEQFHPDPAGCPDEPDGGCREWACAVCGDAVVIGLPASGPDPAAGEGRSRAA
jgi:hypothetical protein